MSPQTLTHVAKIFLAIIATYSFIIELKISLSISTSKLC